ncbi:hypothetical protein [Mixta gaviniae]|uniref:hypothetical protein n=1 Tax=Mixta gaviniae TaxID=665914 RepID=UPI00142E3FBD|nr:hypothetical protein [Mixta gaviniae]
MPTTGAHRLTPPAWPDENQGVSSGETISAALSGDKEDKHDALHRRGTGLSPG